MDFVHQQLQEDFTPIFEWCSSRQSIVLHYPQDRLVLTELRHMLTGEYVTYEQMLKQTPKGVEVVKAVTAVAYQNLDDVVRAARQLYGEEGWVIRFNSGEMVKLKCDEYVRQHRVLESLRWEKDVLALTLAGEVDDVRGIVSPQVQAQLDQFERAVNEGVLARARVLETVVEAAKGMDRKTFATIVVAQWPQSQERSLLFKIFEGQSAVTLIIDMLKKHMTSQRDVDSVQ